MSLLWKTNAKKSNRDVQLMLLDAFNSYSNFYDKLTYYIICWLIPTIWFKSRLHRVAKFHVGVSRSILKKKVHHFFHFHFFIIFFSWLHGNRGILDLLGSRICWDPRFPDSRFSFFFFVFRFFMIPLTLTRPKIRPIKKKNLRRKNSRRK